MVTDCVRTGRSAMFRAAIVCALMQCSVLATPIDRVGEKLEDVQLRTLHGESVSLMQFHTGDVLVIAYTGRGCPISGRYAPRLEELAQEYSGKGVRFVGINASPQDGLDSIAAEIKEFGITFPVLKDADQALTRQLDALTTTEVFVVDKERRIRYRGAVDDQFALGAARTEPNNRYLEKAIGDVLKGRDPFTLRTAAPGCRITRVPAAGGEKKDAAITYSGRIAGIIQDNCQQCHRPKQIGPFPLMTYEEVAGWSAMIHAVVEDGRMPPWNADKAHDGQFFNERKLPDEDRAALLAWIDAGMPRGNPAEDPPEKAWSERWRIGKPDKVFTVREMFTCPKDGVVEYQYFLVPTNYKEDRWITAMECRPGAEDVVHHILVFIRDRNKPENNLQRIGLEDGFLAGQVPGDIPPTFSPGYAKKLPAGADLIFQVHYTPNGKVRKDRSSIAMSFTTEPVEYEVRTRGIYNDQFEIPPGATDHEVRAEHTFDKDVLILSLYPHMHFRGKSFRYVAHLPDGTEQTLLNVPRYDYNWQESYILKDPVRLPKGTKLECIAVYDNSSENFVNPDPSVAVKFGEQSWEEMMIGYIDYVFPEERAAQTASAASK